MPIFEFKCQSCGHEFEELVRDAKASVPCPKCSARKAERRLSVFAARQAAPTRAAQSAPGGCMRCGDPNGPCGM